MKRRALVIALALALFCGLLPTGAFAEENPTFGDVYENQWFLNDVKYIYQRGLMDGSEGSFLPDYELSRLVLVEALFRLENRPAASDAGFTDVGDMERPAANWAVSAGVVNGYGDGRFGPYDPVTREQMAAMLFRYAIYKGMDSGKRADLSAFSDGGTVNAYAVEPLSWANAEGLVNGIGDGLISPRGTATRAQGAAIVHRYCDNVLALGAPEDPPAFVPAVDYSAAVFGELSKWDLRLGSGMGNWGTVINVEPDGSFKGSYFDMDTISGPGYTRSMKTCNFTGRFANVRKVGGYEYSAGLVELKLERAPGQTWIQDGCKYTSTDPYGVNEGEFRIYLPGRAVSDLPKGFKDWTSVMIGRDKTLKFCGLYNVSANMGFFSREK